MTNNSTNLRHLKHPEATASIFPYSMLENHLPPDVGRAHNVPPVVGVEYGI